MSSAGVFGADEIDLSALEVAFAHTFAHPSRWAHNMHKHVPGT